MAFAGLVCACGVCMALALVVHLGSRGIEQQCPCDTINSACLVRTGEIAGICLTSKDVHRIDIFHWTSFSVHNQ